MKKIRDVLEKKIVIFLFQFLIFTILIRLWDYQFIISFDPGILEFRKDVIQFIANYILYEKLEDTIFIYLCWILISLISILIYFDYKKAYSMNLTTYFIPSFFFYVFLFRYSPTYFTQNVSRLMTQTIILGIIIVLFSIIISLGLSKIKKILINSRKDGLSDIYNDLETKCPYCGASFKSKPKYCYNCSREIKKEENKFE